MQYLGHCQVYVIEAEVEPPPGASCTAMVQTSSEECVGKELPPHAGKFTFLLPADIPRMFQINFKFRSLGEGRNQFGERLIDETKTLFLTHYAPEGLQYFWDGHSLPAINVPIAKKPLVGKFLVVTLHLIIVHLIHYMYLTATCNITSALFLCGLHEVCSHTMA